MSERLKATLVHADREGVLYGVRYSPDGKRIIAGGYVDGIIQVWDAGTGRQLTRFEADYGYRGSAEYFCVSPDWKTVYAPSKGVRKHTPIEKDGKRLFRWEFDGCVRAWDLETGELRKTYRHDPPRNTRFMSLSPDGSRFLTGEELSGESEGAPRRAVSLWDTQVGEFRPLPDGLAIVGTFSPDGRTLAVGTQDDDGYTTALKLFDVATSREKLSIRIPEKFAMAGVHGFTPDGAALLGYVQVFPGRGDWHTWQSHLKLWDAASGDELASFPAEAEKSSLQSPVFSPDGRLFAAVNWQAEQGKLSLFDPAGRTLVETIVLTGKPGDGEKVSVREPAFSPDGQWLAVATQFFPESLGSREPRPEELPQPRIHLVDVSRRVVRETLVAPQGFIGSLCFSPDGSTLAAGGLGKVLLWDLADRSATDAAR